MIANDRLYGGLTLLLLGFLFWIVLGIVPSAVPACQRNEVLLRTLRPESMSCVAERLP